MSSIGFYGPLMGFCLTALGCTTIHYRSKEKIPVYLTGKEEHTHQFSYKSKVKFYIWGLYPKDQTVWVDKIAQEEGHLSLAKLKIEEYLEWDDWLWGVVTLGMYTPRTTILSGFTKK